MPPNFLETLMMHIFLPSQEVRLPPQKKKSPIWRAFKKKINIELNNNNNKKEILKSILHCNDNKNFEGNQDKNDHRNVYNIKKGKYRKDKRKTYKDMHIILHFLNFQIFMKNNYLKCNMLYIYSTYIKCRYYKIYK
ncbi:hypothetical protein PFDG_04945 [Plasmodium falciparum Dd2]|uniref:Uncharacterized protein n=1 Tax=Plasmodium falciparum (isolate Dd2) TaxID=57267 RepID=A0A0L7M9A3_PLAF4|nr:hypothetical protein PFDG_04945 [Plasmodium falciparum Dd2]